MIVAGPLSTLLADVSGGLGAWLGNPTAWLIPVAAFAFGVVVCRFSKVGGRAAAVAGTRTVGTIVPTYREAETALERELERARRNDRSLAVVVIQLDDESVTELEAALRNGNGNGRPEMLARCSIQAAYALAGSILREGLRDIDVATSDVTSRRYIVALPESDRAKAVETGRRMAELILRGTGIGARFGVAEFRKEGVLMEDLVQWASQACGEVGVKGGWRAPSVGVVRAKPSQLSSSG